MKPQLYCHLSDTHSAWTNCCNKKSVALLIFCVWSIFRWIFLIDFVNFASQKENLIKGITIGKKEDFLGTITDVTVSLSTKTMLSFLVRRKEKYAPLVFSGAKTRSNKLQLICKPCFSKWIGIWDTHKPIWQQDTWTAAAALPANLYSWMSKLSRRCSAAPHSELAGFLFFPSPHPINFLHC